MQKKLKLAVLAVCYTPFAFAQGTVQGQTAKSMDESAFTFSEAQLGEDDDMSQNVTILNSNTNVYASEVGFLFSPMRFRYRALDPKYNDIYINGNLMNDLESGQFRYSLVGGLNQQTRNADFSLPFENNNFGLSALGGSNNYNFRAGSQAAGQRFSLAAANRNYSARAMYTFATGFNKKGWAIAGNLTYRWANRGYVEGTFYNALSYYFGVEKRWKNGHSVAVSTWGNPTERASQGASTDEAYWLANDYYYNPYWGYQNGKKRNSRVVNDFAPSAIATWDWDINQKLKLVTSLFGKYSMYKSTKLNYNNAENPHPDYWKNLPSSYAEVWGGSNDATAIASFNNAFNYWTGAKANRQINWDKLYWSNQQAARNGGDALYFIQAKHIDNFYANLSSTLTATLPHKQVLNFGVMLGQNEGRHYQTMEDLLGGSIYHNINSYAVGTYAASDPAVQYDLNTAGPLGLGKLVYEGDKFGYDYRLTQRRLQGWTSYNITTGRWNVLAGAKFGYVDMRRFGYMRNGMFANNSYGRSGLAQFTEGGGKVAVTLDAGRGHVFKIGTGFEWKAPTASTAFVSPEMNNDFVKNLKTERIFSSDFGYQFQNNWLHANINAYFNRMDHVTEWQNFFFDDVNSFTYVSITGAKKEYYGAEAGLQFKLTSFLDFNAIGSYNEAKYVNNANVTYMNSTAATMTNDILMNKGMREEGTPLTTGSLGLSFHQGGWFIDLNANWYDRIFLSYAPSYRYRSTLITMGSIDNNGNFLIPDQAKGHGGWMLDGSIGKSIRLKKGQLNFNLMVTNILNNQKIVSGGYEQSRSDYTTKDDGTKNKDRVYKFSKNPKKYYVFGTNGMFQVSYRF